MCIGGSSVPKPTEYQKSSEPVFKEAEAVMSGRRGTILAGSEPESRRKRANPIGGGMGMGMQGPVSVVPKRTVLGG